MAQKNAVFPRAFCLQCASTSSERVRIVFHGLCYIISAYNLELNANGILICILKLFMIRFFYATFPSIRGAFFLLLNLKPSVCSSQFSVHFFARFHLDSWKWLFCGCDFSCQSNFSARHFEFCIKLHETSSFQTFRWHFQR